MAQEKAIKALMNLNLSLVEAQTYLFLVENGPQKPPQIASALECSVHQIYRNLKKLETKGYVSHFKLGAYFKAERLEKIVSLSIQQKDRETKMLEHTKREVLDKLNSNPKTDLTDT